MLCGRVTNLLSAYLDRELTGAEMLQVREHLARCAACCQEHERLAATKALLGRMAAAEPRGEYVRATMLRLSVARREAAVERREPAWRLWWYSLKGERFRVAALATGLAMAVLACGMALQQPKASDAVAIVARLARADAEELGTRPWDQGGATVTPLPVNWDGMGAPSHPMWRTTGVGGAGTVPGAPLLIYPVAGIQSSGLLATGQ
jgi:anti-sigma factor RsiW